MENKYDYDNVDDIMKMLTNYNKAMKEEEEYQKNKAVVTDMEPLEKCSICEIELTDSNKGGLFAKEVLNSNPFDEPSMFK